MNRLLPIMLLKEQGLFKSFKYKSKKYLGDPFNIVNILNSKGVDEATIVNIDGRKGLIDYGFLSELASEAFFPLSYGGNVDNEEMAISLAKSGFEKILFNSSFYDRPQVIRNTISVLGSQAVSINLDYSRNIFGKLKFYKNCATDLVKIPKEAIVKTICEINPGELILSCMDRDGTRIGYDTDILEIFNEVSSQLVLNCGAKNHEYLLDILDQYKSISFAGSAAFFLSPNNEGVLITYPDRNYEM
jgi:cyclase